MADFLILANGFTIRGGSNSWCGEGVYFYDVKNKAWWAAERKCDEIKKKTGKKVESTVLFADIIDIEDTDVFDLRVYKDLEHFENFVRPMLEGNFLEIPESDDIEKIIKLRTYLISFYANKTNKKLVIGCFKQRPQPMYEHAWC